MKYIFLIIIFFWNWSFVWGQIFEKSTLIRVEESKDSIQLICRIGGICVIPDCAMYDGGNNAFYRDFKNNLKYSRRVRKIKGETYLIFTVSKTGKIINPKIENSLGLEYDKIILKALEQTSQDWASARDNRGKPYNQEKRIQITFNKRKFKII